MANSNYSLNPVFDWDEESGVATCIIETKNREPIIGIARCSPKDQDMKGEKTGCFIAECRATINFLRAIKENELKPSLNAYNHLYYSMNMSKRFNPDSYENYMLQRKIAQVENDIETINKTITETKAILNTYMNQKAEAWSKIRKIRQVDKI